MESVEPIRFASHVQPHLAQHRGAPKSKRFTLDRDSANRRTSHLKPGHSSSPLVAWPRVWTKHLVESQFPYSIAAAKGVVYAAETTIGVAGYRAASGKELWRGLRTSGLDLLYLHDVAAANGRIIAHAAQYAPDDTHDDVLIMFAPK